MGSYEMVPHDDIVQWGWERVSSPSAVTPNVRYTLAGYTLSIIWGGGTYSDKNTFEVAIMRPNYWLTYRDGKFKRVDDGEDVNGRVTAEWIVEVAQAIADRVTSGGSLP